MLPNVPPVAINSTLHCICLSPDLLAHQCRPVILVVGECRCKSLVGQRKGQCDNYVSQVRLGAVRTMPHNSGLLKALWAEAFSTTTHVRNRMPRSALEGRTHYEMVYSVKPDLTDLHASNTPCSSIEPSDQVSSCVHQVVNIGMKKTYKGFGE